GGHGRPPRPHRQHHKLTEAHGEGRGRQIGKVGFGLGRGFGTQRGQFFLDRPQGCLQAHRGTLPLKRPLPLACWTFSRATSSCSASICSCICCNSFALSKCPRSTSAALILSWSRPARVIACSSVKQASLASAWSRPTPRLKHCACVCRNNSMNSGMRSQQRIVSSLTPVLRAAPLMLGSVSRASTAV